MVERMRRERGQAGETAELVRTAGRLAPGRCACFNVALATQRLLRDQGIPASVRIAALKERGELMEHAWVEAGEEVLLGPDDVHEAYDMLAWPRRFVPAVDPMRSLA